MGLIRNTALFLSVFCIFFTVAPSYAAWKGPTEIISGSWGSGAGQFYFSSGDLFDSFPQEIGVDANGLIIIPDPGNKRVVVYNAKGTLRATIVRPAQLPPFDDIKKWPLGFILYSGGNSFVVDCNFQQTGQGRGPLNVCFLDYSGSILARIDYSQVVASQTGFVTFKNNSYSFYSPTGQFVKTTADRPLELGRITSSSAGAGQYKTTAVYPDATYQFIDPQPTMQYSRDMARKFYRIDSFTATVGNEQVAAYQVHKYDTCSKKIGFLDMPRSSYEPMPASAADMPTWKPAPIMEYGEPLVAPNGDVYCWARTKTHYKILKWTWVDDPDTPPCPEKQGAGQGKPKPK